MKEITKVVSVNNETNTQKFRITEGVVLASIPIMGYLIAYCYENGYASVFKIPVGLISLDLKTIFISIFAVAGSAYLIIMVINFLFMLIPKDKPALSIHLIAFLFPISFYLVSFMVLPWNLKHFIIMTITISIIAFFDFAWPLIFYKEKTFDERLAKCDAAESKNIGLVDLVAKKIGGFNFLIIFTVFMLLVLANEVGQANAMKQKDFYIIETNDTDQLAVLRIYDNKLIASPIDIATNKVKIGDIVIKQYDNGQISLKQKQLEPIGYQQ